MAVSTLNRFNLLVVDDEEAPAPAPAAAKDGKKAETGSKPAAAAAPAGGRQQQQQQQAGPSGGAQRDREQRAPREPREFREPREPREPRPPRDGTPAVDGWMEGRDGMDGASERWRDMMPMHACGIHSPCWSRCLCLPPLPLRAPSPFAFALPPSRSLCVRAGDEETLTILVLSC